MWCSTCQQDVPAMGTPRAGAPSCGKCGTPFVAAEPAARASTADHSKLVKVLTGSTLVEDDWTLEAELRGVERLVSSLKSSGGLARQPLAVDTPHESAAGWHAARHSPAAQAAERPAAAEPQKNLAAWAILSLGLAVFACGAVLLTWSLVGKRSDLWPVGMPLALIGQAGLILGLILQLDGLWQTSRKTVAALSELDDELKHVRQATTLLSTTRTSGAQTFYAHLAEGASPQMLLADLKGQLDLVAQQVGKRG
jgi:hypothetical protein